MRAGKVWTRLIDMTVVLAAAAALAAPYVAATTPSGRAVAYPAPKFVDSAPPFHIREGGGAPGQEIAENPAVIQDRQAQARAVLAAAPRPESVVAPPLAKTPPAPELRAEAWTVQAPEEAAPPPESRAEAQVVQASPAAPPPSRTAWRSPPPRPRLRPNRAPPQTAQLDTEQAAAEQTEQAAVDQAAESTEVAVASETAAGDILSAEEVAALIAQGDDTDSAAPLDPPIETPVEIASVEPEPSVVVEVPEATPSDSLQPELQIAINTAQPSAAQPNFAQPEPQGAADIVASVITPPEPDAPDVNDVLIPASKPIDIAAADPFTDPAPEGLTPIAAAPQETADLAIQRPSPTLADAPPAPTPVQDPSPTETAAVEDQSLTDLEVAQMIYGDQSATPGGGSLAATTQISGPALVSASFGPAIEPAPAAPAHGPRIVLVIGALGLNDAVTRRALSDLPSGVTLAFAPARPDAARYARRAARDGRVFLVEIPMEPVNYPALNPGPLTLLTANSATQNAGRIDAALARVPGAVGASAYLGARFAADPQASSALAAALKQRGLPLYEGRPSARSLLDEKASGVGLPYLRGGVLIDADRNPAAIDAALARLEETALQNGFAIGAGAAYAETIAAVSFWADGLEKRGARLVPITQAFPNP